MPLIEYVRKKFNEEHKSIIAQANSIIAEWRAAGYDLTLRQLYYQFVRRISLNRLPSSFALLEDGR